MESNYGGYLGTIIGTLLVTLGIDLYHYGTPTDVFYVFVASVMLGSFSWGLIWSDNFQTPVAITTAFYACVIPSVFLAGAIVTSITGAPNTGHPDYLVIGLDFVVTTLIGTAGGLGYRIGTFFQKKLEGPRARSAEHLG